MYIFIFIYLFIFINNLGILKSNFDADDCISQSHIILDHHEHHHNNNNKVSFYQPFLTGGITGQKINIYILKIFNK